MTRYTITIIFLYFLKFTTLIGQPNRTSDFDVLIYDINIELNDTTDIIKGETKIVLELKRDLNQINLDLTSVTSSGNGMEVEKILLFNQPVEYRHEIDIVTIFTDHNEGDTLEFIITYNGEPDDGLIISNNIHGYRTFFTDNWPARAHHWLPCADHPSDKARVNFTITAPSRYQVIATGNKKMVINNPNNQTTSHYWESGIPVSTKDISFGVAEFAVKYMDDIDSIPYSNWVYSSDAEKGFNNLTITPGILDFFLKMIGPYPFEKLSNVQSTIPNRGMGNAGNIFYDEKTIPGDQSFRHNMVKTTAHQWFGNSVTESDWSHLWLSESIAVWLTNIYFEEDCASDTLKKIMKRYRANITDLQEENPGPLVDQRPVDFERLLSQNHSLKGVWVLHMLRRELGRDTLIKGLVDYYNKYKLSNASTNDLIKSIELVSGNDLSDFADDWIYSAGHPVLTYSSRFNNKRLHMEISQLQQHKMAFSFPLDIKFVFEDGSFENRNFDITFRRHEFIIDLPSEPVDIIFDPETWLLFELQ